MDDAFIKRLRRSRQPLADGFRDLIITLTSAIQVRLVWRALVDQHRRIVADATPDPHLAYRHRRLTQWKFG
jgi:hypothetical protein